MPVVPAGSLHFDALPGRLSATRCRRAGRRVPARAWCGSRPGPRTPHVHPHSAEVVYVAAGTGTAWEDDVPTQVGAGDVVVVPAGVPHATVASGTSDLVLVCFFPHPDLAANIEELTGPVRTAL